VLNAATGGLSIAADPAAKLRKGWLDGGHDVLQLVEFLAQSVEIFELVLHGMKGAAHGGLGGRGGGSLAIPAVDKTITSLETLRRDARRLSNHCRQQAVSTAVAAEAVVETLQLVHGAGNAWAQDMAAFAWAHHSHDSEPWLFAQGMDFSGAATALKRAIGKAEAAPLLQQLSRQGGGGGGGHDGGHGGGGGGFGSAWGGGGRGASQGGRAEDKRYSPAQFSWIMDNNLCGKFGKGECPFGGTCNKLHLPRRELDAKFRQGWSNPAAAEEGGGAAKKKRRRGGGGKKGGAATGKDAPAAAKAAAAADASDTSE
jgi:hypothetical protein